MTLADLTLDRWRTADAATAHRVARAVAAAVGGRVVHVDTPDASAATDATVPHRVRVERGGREFALIPGGRVSVGFDLGAWRPTPGQSADYAASVARGFGHGDDLRAHLAQVLSPRREVVLPALLMAVEDEALTAPPADMPAVLADRGLRLPTPDEWEHACGAGAGTLFRWGDECPLDRDPYEDRTGPHRDPNAFGLRIAYDTYRAELTSDTTAVHGGDGGESVCGGYGALLAWLPLATSNRNPAMADFLRGPDGEGMYEEFGTRPVLPL
ncbi:formylglycine-generating enzyme family protein [Streptomyces sp. LP11]|uniref:Formylglycine-generating enzyme family protein n=1 Tax=Streptomyces pyxinicus TaxID=2970331 RepID=A0ABT2B030_9ACTN|nr:formylglycine-generating enzyme family protein [Streptomyces sp. LP11]MCS0601855.1 formylglycine-generating enzyme family protein [Streptomyces sp. LP11]